MNVSKDDLYYLKRMLEDIDFIITSMENVSKDTFSKNVFMSDSMHFRLIQIQENAKYLSEDMKSKHKEIPWADISGMRNRIVHDYGNVNFNQIFRTLTEDIPLLKEQIEKLVNELQSK